MPIPERCVAGFAPFATRDKAKTRAKEPQWLSVIWSARSARREYPLEALYVCERCFGPLEVAYDHGRSSGTWASCAAGSRAARRTSGATPTSCRSPAALPGPSGRLASRVGLPAGCTPLIRADRLAERLACARCGSRTTPPTRRTRSRTGSSRSPSRGRGSWASRRSRALRPATSPTRSRLTARRWALSPTSSSPPTWRSRRSLPRASTGPSWWAWRATTTTSTACAPSSAPSATGRS